jgi:chemotaxis signal transduction protein
MNARRHKGAKHMVGFSLCGGKYAVAIEDVREVIHPTTLTVLPKAPRTVVGMVDHRSEVIVVVDLRTHFELNDQPRPAREKWILLRRKGVALVVDHVTHVFGLAAGAARPRVSGQLQRGLLGVVSPDEHEGREGSVSTDADSEGAGKLTFQIDVRVFEELSESLRTDESMASSDGGSDSSQR